MSDMSKDFAEARARGEAANMRDEVASLRLMLREVAQTDATGIDYALRCQRERDEARAEAEEAAAAYNAVAADLRRTAAELATTQRELHRLIHGTAIEGDGACEHEIHADAARAWARLWHREARRLWREVQDLSKELDVIGWRVRYEWRPGISRPWSEARSDLLSFPDARATASNLRRDPRTYAVRVVRVYRRRRTP